MSWRDCISSAVAAGRISERKGTEAHAAYDEALEEALAEGATEGEAVLRAADAAVAQITELKKAKRWARLNDMQRQHEIYTRLMGSADPRRGLEHLMDETELSYETVRGIAMANLD